MDKWEKSSLPHLFTTCVTTISLEAETVTDRETEIKKGPAISHLFELFQGNTFLGDV